MTGLEFRAKALTLGLKTQKDVAQALDITVRTVSTIWNADKVKTVYQFSLYGYELMKNKGEV